MSLYPEIEPFDQGILEVGDGNRVYWEVCGNPAGKPALVLHADIELLRAFLGISQWLVLGGSWGCTLGLAYAEQHPSRVSALIRDAGKLFGIPGLLVHGRLDLSSPPDIPIALAEAWPSADLVLIDDAGQGAGHPGMSQAVVAATDRFARA